MTTMTSGPDAVAVVSSAAGLVQCRQVDPAPSEQARLAVTDTITLDETDRHRRRFAMTSDGGIRFLLELQHATLLRDGDHLVLDDGRQIRVHSTPEALYEVRGNDANHLLRLSWHVGNRHLPTQVMHDRLRIRRDPVIRDMLEGLGAIVSDIEAGFDPESGAYEAKPHAHAGHSHGQHDPHSHD